MELQSSFPTAVDRNPDGIAETGDQIRPLQVLEPGYLCKNHCWKGIPFGTRAKQSSPCRFGFRIEYQYMHL